MQKDIIKLLKERPHTYKELSQELGFPKPKIRRMIQQLKQEGAPIESEVLNDYGTKGFYINVYGTGGETERYTDYFGLVSDMHYGSNVCKEEEIDEYYDILHDRGIKTVFNCGDLINGEGVYKGQQFENKIHGINNQSQYFVDNLPKLKDGKQYLITGNHDLKQFQKSGVEVGDLIMLMAKDKGRNDLEYLGRYQGRVIFDEFGHTIDLSHFMRGGSAYTMGYRAQVRQRDEPPHLRSDILALGHKHIAMFMDYNDQLIFEAGCFQGQTDWLLSKGINSVIAGWIVELETDSEKITRIKPELIKFDS